MEPLGPAQVLRVVFSLFTLTQHNIFFVDGEGVKAAKKCHIKSLNCIGSNELIAQSDVFLCPHRGHFLYPNDHFRYYRCLGAGWFPCLCWCRYRQMCFDSNERRCEFAFLNSNCSLSTTLAPSSPKPIPTSNKEQPHSPNSLYTSLNDTFDLSYRFKYQRPSDSSQQRPRSRSYNHVGNDVLTAQELILAQRQLVAAGGKVKDVYIFPAWAVAAIVLCIVMVLVLMAIFLY